LEFEQLIIKGNQKTIMGKKISTKVNYQVTELVNNLNEASTTLSEQKRDFFTTKALYNAKRLSSILNKAKVGAMSLVLVLGLASCGTSSTEVKSDSTISTTTDSTSVVSDTTKVDTTSVVK
jgi:hypothetical protein